MNIEAAKKLLMKHGYSVDADETALAGGEEPKGEPGEIMLVQNPFRIERSETGWCVSSWAEGQVAKEMSFSSLSDAVKYVVEKRHLEPEASSDTTVVWTKDLTPSDRKHCEREEKDLLNAIKTHPKASFEHPISDAVPASVVFKLVEKLVSQGYDLTASPRKFPTCVQIRPSNVLPPGCDEVEREFFFHERVGSGAFADVWKAEEIELGRFVAIKFLKDDVDEISIEMQAKALVKVQDHPNVVKVFRLYTCSPPGAVKASVGIVMPFLDGPTLKEYLKEQAPTSPERFFAFTRQLIAGTKALHEAGVAHTDIHGDNIKIVKESVQIIDVMNRRSLTAYTNATVESKFADDVQDVADRCIYPLLKNTEVPFDTVQRFGERVRRLSTFDELETALVSLEGEMESRPGRILIKVKETNDEDDVTLSDEHVKRDIETLSELLENLPDSVLEGHFGEVSEGKVASSALFFWEGFHPRVTASSFFLHDSQAHALVETFHRAWDALLSHSEWFEQTSRDWSIHTRGNPRIPEATYLQQRVILEEEAVAARAAYGKLMKWIKKTHPEIDYRQAFQKARQSLREHLEDDAQGENNTIPDSETALAILAKENRIPVLDLQKIKIIENPRLDKSDGDFLLTCVVKNLADIPALDVCFRSKGSVVWRNNAMKRSISKEEPLLIQHMPHSAGRHGTGRGISAFFTLEIEYSTREGHRICDAFNVQFHYVHSARESIPEATRGESELVNLGKWT